MMEPSTLFEITKALGIPDDLAAKWNFAPKAAPVAAARPRFDLDGVIVDTLTSSMFSGVEGLVSPKSMREFLEKHEGADIDLVINSPGGSVYDAYAMRGELMRHEGFVNVVVNGLCASAATYFLCLENSHRTAMPGADFMIHNAFGGAMGDAKKLMKAAEVLQRINVGIAKQLEVVTNLKKDELLKMMDEETWFSDEEALNAGLVDEIYAPSDNAADGMPDEAEDEEIIDEEKPEALIVGDRMAMLRTARIIESVRL